MADNYLENKMEEHRRNCGAKAPRRTPAAALPTARLAAEGKLIVEYPRELRVFVTGGASGIGRAIVERFRSIGAKVDFVDIDRERGAKVAQATGARFIPCDVADPAALEEALALTAATRGDIDVAVNNAGIGCFTAIDECDTELFDRVVATNLRPAFIVGRFLARHRSTLAVANPYGGRVINIASTRAVQSEASTDAYSASKGGVRSLTHSLMMSLAPWRITVNSISPGWIECGDYDALSVADHAQHPSGRVGRPDDIAHIALFLAHPSSDFINGADITADGGMTRRMIYVE